VFVAAALEEQDDNLRTPLECAAMCKRPEGAAAIGARLIIAAGADAAIGAHDSDAYTAPTTVAQARDVENPPEERRDYSSIWNGATKGTGLGQSQLHGEAAWKRHEDDYSPWMVFDLTSVSSVVGIAIQGCGKAHLDEYTTRVRISCSDDRSTWAAIGDFNSNKDRSTVASIYFQVLARYIKIVPLAHNVQPCIRAAVYTSRHPGWTLAPFHAEAAALRQLVADQGLEEGLAAVVSEDALAQNTAEIVNFRGRADKAMTAGTRICVAGRGRGSYVSFARLRMGANEHTIAFDSGETVAVKLQKKTEWTVKEHEMDAMDPPPEPEPEVAPAPATELGSRFEPRPAPQPEVATIGERSTAARASPRWVPDGEAGECMLCAESFGMRRSRHHCRRCGWVVCASCSEHKLVLERWLEAGKPHALREDRRSDRPLRVCDMCHTSLLEQERERQEAAEFADRTQLHAAAQDGRLADLGAGLRAKQAAGTLASGTPYRTLRNPAASLTVGCCGGCSAGGAGWGHSHAAAPCGARHTACHIADGLVVRGVWCGQRRAQRFVLSDRGEA